MTDIFLHGKTAIITGDSSKLGERFASALVHSGCRVILASSHVDKLEILSHKLGNARAIKMDISNKESVQRCFSDLEKSSERIDICVNNAGVSDATPIFEEDQTGHFETIMKSNIIGPWYVTKSVANHMKSHGIYGSIINITSVCSPNKSQVGAAPYYASKSTTIKMTKELVKELSPHHIRINCISPDLFHTSLVDDELNNSKCKNLKKSIVPLGFVVETAEDLDGLLLWLSSNMHSSYITGASITIDVDGVNWGVA